jgi:hypothetical protein
MKKNWITIAAYITLTYFLISHKSKDEHVENEYHTKTEIQNISAFGATGMTQSYYSII